MIVVAQSPPPRSVPGRWRHAASTAVSRGGGWGAAGYRCSAEKQTVRFRARVAAGVVVDVERRPLGQLPGQGQVLKSSYGRGSRWR